MIFTVVIVCVLGRDFGCMLKAERASRQSGSTQSLPDGTTATAAAIAGPSLSCPSINHNNRNGDRCDDLESSIDGSERVEGCCSCQRRRRRRGRELERSAAASTEGSAETTQTQRCCSGMKDEDLDESVFTGQCACVRVCVCVCVCVCECVARDEALKLAMGRLASCQSPCLYEESVD